MVLKSDFSLRPDFLDAVEVLAVRGSQQRNEVFLDLLQGTFVSLVPVVQQENFVAIHRQLISRIEFCEYDFKLS